MYKTQNYEISSCDDIELGIKRESLLEFRVSFDDKKEMKGLFFFIAGLGEDNNQDYQEKISRFVVKEFQMAVVRVDYHCIGSRPQTGAKFYLDEIDKLIVYEACKALEIELPSNFMQESEISDQDASKLMRFISANLAQMKKEGYINHDFVLPLHTSLKPPKNEYQNFGLMQALDCLNTLLYLKKDPPFKLKKDFHTIMMGSSHGGYIAHLAAKYAPWAIDGVLDNSSYAILVKRFVGFGKEIDYTTMAEFGTMQFFPHIYTLGSTKTFFTSNKSSKNYFSKACARIRSPFDKEHLSTQAKLHKPVYISYHSIGDTKVAPYQVKVELYECLKNLNFDATLHFIKDQSEVDGQFIKNLDHGMGMSLKTLIQKELPNLLAKKVNSDKKDIKEVSYLCDIENGGGRLMYHFKEEDDKIVLRINKD
ncbi:hypothetical protein DMB92_06840 [Campylobacter sp. MIT 99-7217]|uniref:DUF2920 family protein n=1 Tax=Campylobacter sp. MIT 99-7217 TaxID=535091 RepID=UPI001158F8AE|nr:DUF2920 family protein [Campylobacter sp. MIT 99-7217]TQR30936.1 hypothetical protein DMB92_06840 [Campylobacter sp. MIT 99-7217]